MKYTPRTEKELDEANLLPEGNYTATVTEAEDTVSSKGNEMIALTLTIYEQSGEQRKILDWILEAMPWKLRHFCEATGLDYESGEVKAADCMGKSVTVELKVEPKTEKYRAKNSVKDYTPVEVPVEQQAGKDDDLPF